jgi:hypothetical protein
MILRQKNHTDALVLKVKAEGQERSNCSLRVVEISNGKIGNLDYTFLR